MKWSKEKITEEALKYSYRGEWRKHSSYSYYKAIENGWLEELTRHMGRKLFPKGYWTKDRIIEDAKKYTNKKEWNTNSHVAYITAYKNGWYEEATSHMPVRISKVITYSELYIKGLKRCNKCSKIKRLNNFFRSPKKKEGVRDTCKKCNRKILREWKMNNPDKVREQFKKQYHKNPGKFREQALKQKYGMTLVDYDRMFSEQDGKCKICKTDKNSKKPNFAVDHCHKTGKVRGLLCDKCNHGLGQFKDNEELLLAAIEYLKSSKEST